MPRADSTEGAGDNRGNDEEEASEFVLGETPSTVSGVGGNVASEAAELP
jgi:hypothetical protein